MKKYLVPLCAAVLLFTASCGAPDITVIDEITTAASKPVLSQIEIEQIAPAKKDVSLPHTVYLHESEFDVSSAAEIMEEEANISGLGADRIMRCGKTDLYYYTQGETAVTIMATREDDGLFLTFYYGGEINKYSGDEFTWYYADGVIVYAVNSYATEGGGLIYTFYTPSGDKVFTRVGNEYYGADFTPLDSAEIENLRQTYGTATEFADN